MEKSYVTADDICESKHSVPRPIKLPSAVVGYMADLIKVLAEEKVKHVQNQPR
jgi:hypothetical protein